MKITFSTNGWDHWLRGRIAALGLEGIYPSYPRLHHLLYSEGTTTNLKKNKRIVSIPYYKALVPVNLGDLSYLLKPNYDRSLLMSFLPSNLVEDAYHDMQIPLSDIILHRRPYNSSIGSRFSFAPYKYPPSSMSSSIVVVGRSELIRIRNILTTSAFSTIIILVADEVSAVIFINDSILAIWLHVWICLEQYEVFILDCWYSQNRVSGLS